jgi:hypothetical protein
MQASRGDVVSSLRPMIAGSEALAEQLAYYRAVADDYEDYTIDVPG